MHCIAVATGLLLICLHLVQQGLISPLRMSELGMGRKDSTDTLEQLRFLLILAPWHLWR